MCKKFADLLVCYFSVVFWLYTVCSGIHSSSTFTQYFTWGHWFRCIMGVKWVGKGAHYVLLPQEKSEVTVLSWHLIISGHMFNALDRTAKDYTFCAFWNLGVYALFCDFCCIAAIKTKNTYKKNKWNKTFFYPLWYKSEKIR